MRSSNTTLLRTLWGLMRGYRLRYVAAILFVIPGSLLGFSIPLALKGAIDGAIAGQPVDLPGWLDALLHAGGGWTSVRAHLGWLSLLIIVLGTASGLCGYLRGRFATRATEGVARVLRARLYAHLQSLPMSYLHAHDLGDLVQRCTSDVETIRTFFSTQVVEIGRALLMLIIVTPLMFSLDHRMPFIALALVPVIVAFATLYFKRVQYAFKLSDEAEGRLTNTIQENLTGIRVVRAFARQAHELEKFSTRNVDYRDATRRLVDKMAVYWAASEMLCVGQNGLNLVGGAWLLARGEISVGTLFSFMAMVGMLLWPVRQMGSILTDMGKALVAIGRVREILDAAPETESAVPQSATRLTGAMGFENVTFGYKPDHAVLQGVSFELRAGETLAIVGPTGSGKTTLINLLLRLYDYDTGSITLDGRELRDLPRAWVREQISVVLQQPFLFSKTLRENIAHGRGDGLLVGMEEIEGVATAACVHDAIRAFEHGYETEIGERGVTLSGGQRQRVALARALLRRPPVLVLDDALSAVDTHTETQILAALEQRRGEQTTLIITHRLSSIRLADRVLVLEHGRVAQLGTHRELVAQPGLYRELWALQGELEADLREELQPAG